MINFRSLFGLPEKKGPTVPYADFGTRVIASTIDMILSIVVLAPVLSLFSNLIYSGYDRQSIQLRASQSQTIGEVFAVFREAGILDRILIDQLFQTLIMGGVIIFFWMRFGGTPGKLLLRMRIVDADTHQPPTLTQSIIRFFGYIISALPFMLGFISIVWSKRRQGWHDKMANTVVLVKKWKWQKRLEGEVEEEAASSLPQSADPSGSPAPALGE